MAMITDWLPIRARKRDPINLPGPMLGWRRLVPRTLFARALLIILIPLFLMQAIAVGYFFDTHWNRMTERLAIGVVGELTMTVELLERARSDDERQQIFNRSSRITGIVYSYDSGADVADSVVQSDDRLVVRKLASRLEDRFGDLFQVGQESEKWLRVDVQVPGGVMTGLIPLYRLFSQSSLVFLVYLVGSAVVLFSLALIFMRNQIRPIRRLAKAADGFGKGRDPVDFRLEGAAEVRQAGRAFLLMRERLKRQISQRTAMLAGVSHDLRTPLTRLKLQLAMLGDGPEIDDMKSDLAEMEAMIEGYLAFARGEEVEAAEPVKLGDLLAEVIAGFKRDGAVIALTLPETLPVLTGKPNGLKRCFSNLIGNAKRYGGKIWIHAAVRRGAIEISIEDDGPGIPETELEQVFRPFYRLEASRNTGTGGTGLGLTIARDIARDHGGDVALSHSDEHGGLAANIRLPI